MAKPVRSEAKTKARASGGTTAAPAKNPRSTPAKGAPEKKKAAPVRVEPSWILLGAGLIIGLYAMAPGIYLDGLHVKRGAEIIDHVVPSVVVLAVVALALYFGHKSINMMLVGGMIICLAGFWMVAVHVSLFQQALNHKAPWGATIYHCSTAVLVLGLGVVWTFRYYQLAD